MMGLDHFVMVAAKKILSGLFSKFQAPSNSPLTWMCHHIRCDDPDFWKIYFVSLFVIPQKKKWNKNLIFYSSLVNFKKNKNKYICLNIFLVNGVMGKYLLIVQLSVTRFNWFICVRLYLCVHFSAFDIIILFC